MNNRPPFLQRVQRVAIETVVGMPPQVAALCLGVVALLFIAWQYNRLFAPIP